MSSRKSITKQQRTSQLEGFQKSKPININHSINKIVLYNAEHGKRLLYKEVKKYFNLIIDLIEKLFAWKYYLEHSFLKQKSCEEMIQMYFNYILYLKIINDIINYTHYDNDDDSKYNFINEEESINKTNKTNEIKDTNKTNKTNEIKDTNKTNKTNETNETNETNKTNKIKNTNETNETNEINEAKDDLINLIQEAEKNINKILGTNQYINNKDQDNEIKDIIKNVLEQCHNFKNKYFYEIFSKYKNKCDEITYQVVDNDNHSDDNESSNRNRCHENSKKCKYSEIVEDLLFTELPESEQKLQSEQKPESEQKPQSEQKVNKTGGKNKKTQKEKERKLKKAQKEKEIKKAQKERERKLKKAQKEKERKLKKAQKEKERKLKKAQKEKERKLKKAQKEKEKNLKNVKKNDKVKQL